MDWNNDGRKDLIVGESYYGKVRIYLNNGTDANPSFSSYFYLQVGGGTFSVGNRAMPEVVDWNNDGRKDLLVGCEEGTIYLLINTGTDANPEFSSASLVMDGAAPLDISSASYDRSAPVVMDWNQDGKKDLLVGEYYGRIFYYENKGTDASPVFNGGVPLSAGGSTLYVGYYSRPTAADWDRDGFKDLIVGDYYGYVYYFRRVPLDNDADGLYDFWEYNNFGGIDVATGAGDADGDGLSNSQEYSLGTNPNDADTDHDGMSDREEWIAGTSPTNVASVFQIENFIPGPGADDFVCSWQGHAGRLYSVYSALDLNGGWQTDVYHRAGVEGLMSCTNAPGGARKFLRIGVERP